MPKKLSPSSNAVLQAPNPNRALRARQAKKESANAAGEANSVIAAIDRSQATIEFDIDGKILTANANFLRAMGYTLEEIQGKRHSMFVDEQGARSQEYRDLWDRLRRGEF